MKTNYLKIGCGLINSVEEALCANNISGKILYVSGCVVDKIYGAKIKNQIKQYGELKEEYVNYNTIEYAMKIAERCIATDIDCIVGLGGGKVLDVCKYAAYVSKTKYLAIPTTAANDGLVSPIAVLKRNDGLPRSLGAAMPDMALIDIEVIAEGPVQNIKAGIGDTISNYMALKDWNLAEKRGKDHINTYAYLMSKNSLDALMNVSFNEINLELVEILINSLLLSGIAMEFAGSSRPVSGAEHCFSHALDYFCPKKNLHGLQVALGTIAILKMIDEPYDELLKYLHNFNVVVNPSILGIDKSVFVACMQSASSMRKGRYTYLDEINLSSEILGKVYDDLLLEL